MLKRNIKNSSKENQDISSDLITGNNIDNSILNESCNLNDTLDEVLDLFKNKNSINQIKRSKHINDFIKNIQSINNKIAKQKKENEFKLVKLVKFLISCWDIILLTLLIIIFSTYLVYFLNIYFSPNQKVKLNNLNRNLTKLSNWFISKWMYLNGFTDLTKEECAVIVPDVFNSILRPIDDCSMCIGVDKIVKIDKISKEDFLDKYAYTGVPVVIKNSIAHWSAMKVVNFDFLRDLYLNMTDIELKRKRENKMNAINKNINGSTLLNTFNLLVENDVERTKTMNFKDTCQFFPYKTKFKSLRQVFEAVKTDENKLNIPWYVGWSNCNSYASQILRKHYERPDFLPDESEMSRLDWIFMGTPGYGAEIHIDDVQNPSWQAQITGIKHWIFRPPAECIHKCKYSIDVDVYPGDIIIFDSNRWFHSTKIIGKDLSLTIGSEYD